MSQDKPSRAAYRLSLTWGQKVTFSGDNQRGEWSASEHLVHRRSATQAPPPSPTQTLPKHRGMTTVCVVGAKPPPLTLSRSPSLSFGRIWVGLWSVRVDYGLLCGYGLFGASMGVAVGSPGWPKKGRYEAQRSPKPVIPTPLIDPTVLPSVSKDFLPRSVGRVWY